MTSEDGLLARGLGRRPVLKVAVGGAALTSVGVAVRLASSSDGGSPADGVLALSTHAGSDVQSLHLPLSDELLPQAGSRRWESRRLPASTHSMVAFTWSDQDQPPAAQVRARRGGSWTSWLSVPPLLDIPDDEAVEDDRVRGTDLLWVGRADGIQIRIDGRRPSDLALVLLYPEPRLTDDLVGEPARRTATSSNTDDVRVPRPELVTRKEWGANESLRDGEPTYNHTLKQVHIHHTVNANDYSRRDVPGLIRGMYAYHTQTLGWSDIGYNFLVDRFGRAFVGRAGGPRKLVRGAHTLGFNAESTGVSAIGNYETAQPTDAMLNAIAAIAAWKLDRFDRDPRGTIRVESEGSDKYPAGRTVRLPVIDGHRDTNDTACPGGHLYEALPKVRRRTERLIEAAHQRPIVVEQPAVITGDANLGGSLRIEPGSYQPEEAKATYQWLRGDESISGEAGQTYLLRAEDVGTTVGCVMTLTQPGVEPVVQRPTPPAVITARPTLEVVPSSRRRVVRVAVSVIAPPGVEALPTGQVTVTVGDRVKTVELTAGRAEARFGRQRRVAVGKHAVQIVYPGSTVFLTNDWSGSVSVD